jgi:hypothetical protein
MSTTQREGTIHTDAIGDNEQAPLLPSSTISVTAIDEEQTRGIMSGETFWKIGAIYGCTAVALGAFGAHGLKKHIADPAKIGNWSTAATYQVSAWFASRARFVSSCAAACFCLCLAFGRLDVLGQGGASD